MKPVLLLGLAIWFLAVAPVALAGAPMGEFVKTGSMEVGRYAHTATLLKDGRVLLAGGSHVGKILSSAELYDPRTGVVSPTGSLLQPRLEPSAVLLMDGRVLVTGGVARNHVLASSEIYDPATGKFSAGPSMSFPAAARFAILLKDGDVLLGGGGYLPRPAIYQSKLNRFVELDRIVYGGSRAAMMADGRVLITGGSDRASLLYLAEIFSPSDYSFQRTGDLVRPRVEHTITLLRDGNLLITGGIAARSVQAEAELYLAREGRFIQLGNMTTRRFVHTATLLENGDVLIAGGSLGANLGTADAELYHPTDTVSVEQSRTTSR